MDHSVESLGLRFGFTAAIVIAFGALLAFAAAAPDTLATPIAGGLPLSLLLATALILFAIATTGTYVLIVNARIRRGG